MASGIKFAGEELHEGRKRKKKDTWMEINVETNKQVHG
jgi:hypothetical protein